MVSYRTTKDPTDPNQCLERTWHHPRRSAVPFLLLASEILDILALQQTHINIFTLWCPLSPRRTSSARVCWQCLHLSRGGTLWKWIFLHLLILALGSGYYPVDFGCLVQRNCGSQGGHWVQQQLRPQVSLGWPCYRDRRANVVPTKPQQQPRKYNKSPTYRPTCELSEMWICVCMFNRVS